MKLNSLVGMELTQKTPRERYILVNSEKRIPLERFHGNLVRYSLKYVIHSVPFAVETATRCQVYFCMELESTIRSCM